MLVADAEAALARGERATASGAFVEAGVCAATYGLPRAALRCYRSALELDLVYAPAIAAAIRVAHHAGPDAVTDWTDYQHAIGRFTSFGCRGAELAIGDRGSYISCPAVGPVLAVAMPEPDLIEVTPVPRLEGLPLAMAMIIARRGLFISPREQAEAPRSVRVAYARWHVSLVELGEWTRA